MVLEYFTDKDYLVNLQEQNLLLTGLIYSQTFEWWCEIVRLTVLLPVMVLYLSIVIALAIMLFQLYFRPDEVSFLFIEFANAYILYFGNAIVTTLAYFSAPLDYPLLVAFLSHVWFWGQIVFYHLLAFMFFGSIPAYFLAIKVVDILLMCIAYHFLELPGRYRPSLMGKRLLVCFSLGYTLAVVMFSYSLILRWKLLFW